MLSFGFPKSFPGTDLESSRKKLVDLMQDYGAHNDVEVIVVFDGNSRSLKAKVETISPPFSMWCTHR
ncbi:MAG: NYN domain-containing protein [Dialister invisus]